MLTFLRAVVPHRVRGWIDTQTTTQVLYVRIRQYVEASGLILEPDELYSSKFYTVLMWRHLWFEATWTMCGFVTSTILQALTHSFQHWKDWMISFCICIHLSTCESCLNLFYDIEFHVLIRMVTTTNLHTVGCDTCWHMHSTNTHTVWSALCMSDAGSLLNYVTRDFTDATERHIARELFMKQPDLRTKTTGL